MAGFESSCRHISNVVTVKLHDAVFPDASVAVQFTVVVPIGKQDPEAGLQSTTAPEQLQLAVAVKLTVWQVVALHVVWFVTALRFAGHVIVGGCVSFTVTVNVQVGPAELLQMTVVVPTGKNDPEAGEQITGSQAPLFVGGE